MSATRAKALAQIVCREFRDMEALDRFNTLVGLVASGSVDGSTKSPLGQRSLLGTRILSRELSGSCGIKGQILGARRLLGVRAMRRMLLLLSASLMACEGSG